MRERIGDRRLVLEAGGGLVGLLGLLEEDRDGLRPSSDERSTLWRAPALSHSPAHEALPALAQQRVGACRGVLPVRPPGDPVQESCVAHRPLFRNPGCSSGSPSSARRPDGSRGGGPVRPAPRQQAARRDRARSTTGVSPAGPHTTACVRLLLRDTRPQLGVVPRDTHAAASRLRG